MYSDLNLAAVMSKALKPPAILLFWLCATFVVSAIAVDWLEFGNSNISSVLYSYNTPWFPYLSTSSLWLFMLYRVFHLSSRVANSTALNLLGMLGIFSALLLAIPNEKFANFFVTVLLELPCLLFVIFYLVSELKYLLKMDDKTWALSAKMNASPRFFNPKYVVFFTVCALSLVVACGITQQTAKKETAFIELYNVLKREPKLDAVKAKMVNNGSTKSFVDLTKGIKEYSVDDFEVTFLMTHGTYSAMLDLSSPSDAETLSQKTVHFIPDQIESMWNGFKASSDPWVLKSFPSPKSIGASVAGFMRFKTAHGDLIAMVQSKPTFIKFNLPAVYP